MHRPVNIRILMASRGINVSSLAKAANLSETTVRAVLAGSDVRVSTLDKIAEVLSCKTVEFFLDAPTSIVVEAA